jgi:ferredoxin
VRIRVDSDLCQGHGACVQEAPVVFALDPGTNQVVLLEEHPDETLRAAVESAVRYCPTGALALEEEGGGSDGPVSA